MLENPMEILGSTLYVTLSFNIFTAIGTDKNVFTLPNNVIKYVLLLFKLKTFFFLFVA